MVISMKVLHVLNTGYYSGAENVVITLIHTIEGQVECAYASPYGPIEEILKEEKIQYFPMTSKAVNANELKRIISAYKPDLIHTHDFNAGVMTCLTGTEIPIINHLHNNTPWLQTFCLKSLVYFASCVRYKKILTVSNSVMEEFIFGKWLKKKSQVVGNPINLEKIRRKAMAENLINEQSDVIFLGRLSPPKRPVFFLEIIAETVKTIPNIKVAMVGNGELQEEVEAKIQDLKLEKNVKLYGFQKNPYGLLMASKVMCMPSAWEGFGLAAVEAMAFGKPVVAAPVGGLQEIVTNSAGKKCNTLKEFQDELVALLTDTDYYVQKANAAMSRANEYDNSVQYAERICQIYNSLA